jgi:hypothetical protein
MLYLRLKNLGQLRSENSVVNCFVGVPDEPIFYETEEQTWIEIGTVQAGSVGPLQDVEVKIPWVVPIERIRLFKYWPLKCELKSIGDTFAPDNSVRYLIAPAPGL